MANIQLKDLIPGKTYNIQVRSTNANGEISEWSNTYTFVAPPDTSQTLENIYQGQLGSGDGTDTSGVLKSSTFNGTLNTDFSVKTTAGKINESDAGTVGWAIDYLGNAIFNNAYIRGTLDAGGVLIGKNAYSTYPGIKIDTNNYWYLNGSSQGVFSLGGANGITYDGSGNVVIGSGVTILGIATASAFEIDQYNYWNSSNYGASNDFRVGSSSKYFSWVNSTGVLSVKGDITATSGSFTGTVNIASGGSLVAGTSQDGVTISNSGLIGYDNGVAVFTIPTASGTTPTIGNFKVVDTAILSDGANANLIIGDQSTDNITIRGQVGSGIVPAIFTTISGTATTSTSNSGFYIDRSGKFRLAGANGSITMDGSGNLTATGTIKATSGYIGGTTSGWAIDSNRFTNDSGTLGAGLIATSSPQIASNYVYNSSLVSRYNDGYGDAFGTYPGVGGYSSHIGSIRQIVNNTIFNGEEAISPFNSLAYGYKNMINIRIPSQSINPSTYPIISGKFKLGTQSNGSRFVLSARVKCHGSNPLVGKQVKIHITSSPFWTVISEPSITLSSTGWSTVSAEVQFNYPVSGYVYQESVLRVNLSFTGSTFTLASDSDIITCGWIMSEKGQSPNEYPEYFDETYPNTTSYVDYYGYNTGIHRYSQMLYSGSTYSNKDSASFQIGHGGTIYAQNGKFGSVSINENTLYANSKEGFLAFGSIPDPSAISFPEGYIDSFINGIQVNKDNYWAQNAGKDYVPRFAMQDEYLSNPNNTPKFIINSANQVVTGYDLDGWTDADTVNAFNAGAGVIKLSRIFDNDNYSQWSSISGITSQYKFPDGTVTGTVYMYQGESNSWFIGPAINSPAIYQNGTAVSLSDHTHTNFNNSLTASTFYTSNWFRSYNDTGWYNETHHGGMYMYDSSWVRTYNGKGLVGYGVYSNGNVTVVNGAVIANGTGAGTSYFQNIDLDSDIYGSADMYGYVAGGRALRIDSSPYRFGTASSSRRVKSYIESLIMNDQDIENYFNINPVTYFYTDRIKDVPEEELSGKVKDVGLIAEEMQELGFTSLINVDDDGIADYVHYDKLSVYNTMIIKMQQERINNLEARLAALEAK